MVIEHEARHFTDWPIDLLPPGRFKTLLQVDLAFRIVPSQQPHEDK
jgi:hypothetical protein